MKAAWTYSFTPDQLYTFIKKAAKSTYPALEVEEISPEGSGFKDLNFSEGEFSYKDSYTGYFRSAGTEVVKFKGTPVWLQLYRGGMVEGKEALADKTFEFLKKAFTTYEEGFQSFRGPHSLKDGDWSYKYKQEGDISEFQGFEEIFFKDDLVFVHRTIGGLVVPRSAA